MPSRADIVAALNLASPGVVEEIDQVILDLQELRKVAVRVHGERRTALPEPAAVALPVPPVPPTSAPPIQQAAGRDGITVDWLIDAYKTDSDSGYKKLRHGTRTNYDGLLRRISRDIGTTPLALLDARKIKAQHEIWSADGRKKAMAHSLMTMLRALSSFGATWLTSPECRELKITLSGMEFEMPGTRSERLTTEHIRAIREKARQMAVPSIALAQALQSELGLSQKDVIGEWVPNSEPGTSGVIDGSLKWLRGLCWNEIDENLVLHHKPSNQQQVAEFDLNRAPMVIEELEALYCKAGERLTREALPSGSSPVILYERTGRPYLTHQFRRAWRAVASAAGVPKTVMNRDSRSGTADEPDDARAQIGGR
jgi:hypothetical protein